VDVSPGSIHTSLADILELTGSHADAVRHYGRALTLLGGPGVDVLNPGTGLGLTDGGPGQDILNYDVGAGDYEVRPFLGQANILGPGPNAANTRDIETLNVGFSDMSGKVRDEMPKISNPQFLNRIDETIIFKPLTRAEMHQILDIMTADLEKRTSLPIIA
jgi:hypothetical protein